MPWVVFVKALMVTVFTNVPYEAAVSTVTALVPSRLEFAVVSCAMAVLAVYQVSAL